MLAYVFWHCPRSEADVGGYEAWLVRFHASLRAAPPPGFVSSASFRVSKIPWLEAAPGYEDWYRLDGSAGLDTLNEAAVSGLRKTPHDAAARLMERGTAGLFRSRGQRPEPGGAVRSEALWLDRPDGVTTTGFLATLDAQLPSAAAIWQRQMALGPTPEFCIMGEPGSLARLEVPARGQPLLIERQEVTVEEDPS